ncbi:hypothetical protein ACHAQH_007956 [Verticillium albo-atrum]
MVTAVHNNPFAVVKSNDSSAKNPFAEAVAAHEVSRKKDAPPRAPQQAECCKESMEVDSRVTVSERRSHKIACRLHTEGVRAGLTKGGDTATQITATSITAATNPFSTPLKYLSTEMEIDSATRITAATNPFSTPLKFSTEMEIDSAAPHTCNVTDTETPVMPCADMELDSDCEFVQAEASRYKNRKPLNGQSTGSKNKKNNRNRGNGQRKNGNNSRQENGPQKRGPPRSNCGRKAPRGNCGKELFPEKLAH